MAPSEFSSAKLRRNVALSFTRVPVSRRMKIASARANDAADKRESSLSRARALK